MDRGKKRLVIIELLLAAVCVICILMMIRSRRGVTNKRIAVVVEDSENEKWSALRDGINEGAKEKNINIRFVTTGTFDNASDELDSAEEAVNDGCDVLMVWPYSKEAVSLIKKKKFKVPVILLGTDSGTSETTVGFNAFTCGQTLAKSILKDYDRDLSSKTVGFLTSEKKGYLQSQVKKGVESALNGSHYTEKFYTGDGTEKAVRKFLTRTKNRPDILVALDDSSLSLASDLIASNEDPGTKLYGAGFAPSNIYQVDMKHISTMVYPEIFRVGYYGIQAASTVTGFTLRKPESRTVGCKVLTNENLFDDDNEEALMTFRQN